MVKRRKKNNRKNRVGKGFCKNRAKAIKIFDDGGYFDATVYCGSIESGTLFTSGWMPCSADFSVLAGFRQPARRSEGPQHPTPGQASASGFAGNPSSCYYPGDRAQQDCR